MIKRVISGVVEPIIYINAPPEFKLFWESNENNELEGVYDFI